MNSSEKQSINLSRQFIMLQLTIDDPVVDWAIEHAESIRCLRKAWH